MNEDYYVERIGIVDALEGKRKEDQVVHLALKIQFDTEIESENTWNDEFVKDVVRLVLPPGADVNPGDLVHMTLRFTNPRGQRFQPALEMGDPEVVPDESEWQTDESGELVIDANDWTTYPDSTETHISSDEDSHNQGRYMLPHAPNLPAVCSTYDDKACGHWAIGGEGEFTYWCRLHVPTESDDHLEGQYDDSNGDSDDA